MSKTYLSEADFINGVLLRPVPFEVPGLGWVEVRGLSVVEVDDLTIKHEKHPLFMALEAVVVGMVNPKLSPAGVQAMYNGNPGPVEAISMRVLELSGQGDRTKQDPLAGNGSSPPKATEPQ